MLGRTLTLYFSGRLLKWILGLFLFAAVLIFMFDFLELVRRGSDREGFSVVQVALISALRVPSLLEQVLPFATLFGAIAAFVSLSRSLELVVARAAGISVWQFCGPALVLALLVGGVAITLYNPLAVYMKQLSEDTGSSLFGTGGTRLLAKEQEIWLRQDGANGETVLYATSAEQGGIVLFDVSVLQFDRNGIFEERIEADRAELQDGHWLLSNATAYEMDARPQKLDTYEVSTFLSPTEVRERIADPESISFWELPKFVELAHRAGLPAYRYALQYQTLLARPLLLAAMVLIAAAVSLKFSRFGGLGRMILGGILAGFVLYVLSQLTRDLGGAGIIPPVIAAWSPGIVATLMGFSILLHREDG
ncbi:MAG: LPS export ABC transporter permease LptG [Stappiaceae bacterium]